MTTELETDHDVAYEATISMVSANLLALGLLPVASLLFLWPFASIWRRSLFDWRLAITPSILALVLLAFAAGIVVHELLHAFGFVWAGRAPLSAVKFGIMWWALAPFAHCRVPITASAYRISVALPGIILGILPGLIGVAIGVGWLALWGTLMTVSAGGDLAVLLAIRSVPGRVLVLDHPSKAGCLVLEDQEEKRDAV